MDGIKRERVKGGDAPASGRYMVFCTDGEVYGEEGYIFTHEADVMMIATAGEVERGKLSLVETRKLLEPYKDTLTPRSFSHTL